ncbi:MAG: type II secretion system protein [Candidatus Kaiserbacteria bacterium]|nr:type II secretion system protein [Candidatus Kaiserbacteria bacterium]
MTQRAFTLIETIIVIALSVCMMIALGSLLYSFNSISGFQQASLQSSGSASIIMREVESLTFPADAVLQTHQFLNASYTSSSTALVLEIPSVNSSGNVISNTYDYAAFYIVGTNAYRLLEANALSKRSSGTKQLSSTVYTLTFAYDNVDFTKANIVTIDVQTQAYAKQNILSDHRHEQIRLRNH